MESTAKNIATRSCTCHPADTPPTPCPQKFALFDCRLASLEREKQFDTLVEVETLIIKSMGYLEEISMPHQFLTSAQDKLYGVLLTLCPKT